MTETVFVRDLSGLGERLSALGSRRVLVLATPSRRFVPDVTAALAAFAPTVFDGARVHVPVEVVETASAALAASGADTIVAVGGGSPIGLGKALRLTHDVRFVAVPTTYAGSEMTDMYGITTGTSKQTGRNARVKPDLVVYDVAFTVDMPIVLTVQSLLNSVAHVVSVMSTDSLDLKARVTGVVGMSAALHAIEDLILAPTSVDAREEAQRGASVCAGLFDRGKPGHQHALAHLLGGATRLDHAPLHAIILPRFVAYLRATRPDLADELDVLLTPRRVDAFARDMLRRVGAPANLTELGADKAAVAAALATRPDLPAPLGDANTYFA
jgi:maleylacetate reductase